MSLFAVTKFGKVSLNASSNSHDAPSSRKSFHLIKKSHHQPSFEVLQINLQIPFKFSQHLTLMSHLRYIWKYMIEIGHVSSQLTYMENTMNVSVLKQV